jgi:hypothetical protein
MLRHQMILITGLLAALACPAFAQESFPYVVREAAAPCLNVRSDHTSDANAVVCLPPGTSVAGIGAAPYWRKLRSVLIGDDGKWREAEGSFLLSERYEAYQRHGKCESCGEEPAEPGEEEGMKMS